MKHYNIYSFYSSYSTLMHSNHQLRLAAWNNPSQTGKKIKNFIYQYSDIIGKGNFAKVYKGLNLNTQQVLAIKLISLDQLKSKHLETLVFEEIRILQLMNHPNILKFHEALLSERNCYIVTELCNQGSLEDRIKSKVPISEEQLGSIIFDLYYGLKYLREKGVTHRDFKPANIFVHNGQLRIADFGLAKLYKQRFHDLDIGSPHYMSPEGLILNNYSQKTDIWSLGITIYQLLHGITPFAQCQSQQQLVYNITRPIPEHKWRKDINPLLRQFINKLLEIEQLKRPNIYQLYNQPYMRLVVQRQNDKNQQIKLTQSISLCSYSASQESQKKLRNSLSINPFVNQPPNAEKMANINYQHKIQNQRLYSTTSSQNSSRSARNIQLQNSMNFSVKYPSYNNIQHNENPRFSFAKLNQSAKIIVPTQKNQILMTSASIQNRTFNQLPERTAYLENKQSNVYRMQCQQVVPIQNQLLFAHQRQKAVVLQVNSLQNQKRQYPSTLYPRPNNYFY